MIYSYKNAKSANNYGVELDIRKNLYHPFLGAKAVKNDFTIQDDNYYICLLYTS